MANAKNVVKKILIILLVLVLAIVVIVGAYVVYLFTDYKRIEDNFSLQVREGSDKVAQIGVDYTALTYNIGFGAYLPDFGFFMDGGTESWAKSKDSVIETIDCVNLLIGWLNPDFIMLQEVDEDATRSYHVNERKMIEDAFLSYDSVFAVNYDSSFLFYPLLQPHGASLAGMLTLSKFNVFTESAIRKSLPVEDSLMKFFDLDRCYSKMRVQVENGKELVLFTAHLSAYTSDGVVATEQIKILTDDMQTEYDKGNYVICGGDFNKDLLGNSESIFGKSGQGQTWAQPFPTEILKDKNLSLVSSLDEQNPVPSCRNADAPYNENQFVLTVDGFIVSDNVAVKSCRVASEDFLYSDHNPVQLTFALKTK